MDQRLRAMFPSAGGAPATDSVLMDTAETIHISSLALLKMLRHGRAGVPMEVMGLMLGDFVDEYTIRVVDVFAMPQSGTGVSVEAVDPVFQVSEKPPCSSELKNTEWANGAIPIQSRAIPSIDPSAHLFGVPRQICSICSSKQEGRRWSSVGTIHILDSGVGSREWILILSKASSS